MITKFFESESYQSVVDKELKDLEPFLEHIELILPYQPIPPFLPFRLLVKARGSDLPCNGSWFQIAVAEQGLPNATIISQPQGEIISFGMTGEWHVELQAPPGEGDYWLHAIIGSVETDESVVEIPFTVKLNTEYKTESTSRNRPFYLIAFSGFIFAIIWFIFFLVREPTLEFQKERLSNTATKPTTISKTPIRVPEVEKKQALENSETKVFVDELLEKSFNNSSVSVRKKAWQKLSQFIASQTEVDNPYVREILQQRSHHKKQTESWLISNEHSHELLKRLQVLAYVDEDKNAQLWLGNYYSSWGSNGDKHLGKAWQWYQRAANKGNAKAQQLLDELEDRADLLLKSPNLNERIQGYEITEEVAFAGGVNAQLWMGYRYETGDGVNRDLINAANWYRKAAEQGNADASDKLSSILDLIKEQNSLSSESKGRLNFSKKLGFVIHSTQTVIAQ